MYGLPDNALYGTYKRIKPRGRRNKIVICAEGVDDSDIVRPKRETVAEFKKEWSEFRALLRRSRKTRRR